MKKIVKQIKNKITFYKFFLGATLIGVVVLFLSVGINYKYATNMTKVFENNQIRLESLIQNINQESNNKNELIIKNVELPKEDFMKQYYVIQSDWLNKWLTALAIIMAVLGIMIPICFVKFLENKEKEMDRIIKETIKQKDKVQLQVKDVNKKYNYIKSKSDSIAKKAEQVASELNKIKKLSEQASKDAQEAKRYAKEVKASKLCNEASNLIYNKNIDKARELIREAYDLNDKDAEIVELYAIYIHNTNKEYEKEVELLDQAIEINPEQYSFYYNKAMALYNNLKQYTQAVNVMEKAIDKCKNNIHKSYCLSGLSVIYAELQNKEKYEECTNEAIKLCSDLSVLQNIVKASVIILDYERMIEYINKIIRIKVSAIDYYNLTEAYILTNQFDKALNSLNKYIEIQDENSCHGIYYDDYFKWTEALKGEDVNTIEQLNRKINSLSKENEEKTNNMNNLPQGWVECELRDIGEIVSGGTPSTSNPNNFGGNIAWLTPADLSNYQDKYISQGSRNITELGLNTSSAKLMPTGAVLFSSRAPIGYTVIAKNPICTNQGFKNIVLFDGIYNEFVYYFLKNAKAIAEKLASGTTFKEISGSKFGQIPIKVPPLNEQKRIAEKIESEFGKIDRGIEHLSKAKEQIKQYRRSVLYNAFNGDLYKSKVEWKEFELKDVCKNISAGGDKPDIYSETKTELCKIPIYSNGIQKNGLYGYTNVAKIVEPAVTVSARGTIGFVCVRNQPYLPIVRLISVIPDTSILDIEFLKYFLNYIVPKGEGSSIPQLTVPNFKKYMIALPSLGEQQKIVQEIEKHFNTADEAEKIIDENLEKAKQLKQSILKKAFEGRLVPQDPNDEPASVLLEKIKSERKLK